MAGKKPSARGTRAAEEPPRDRIRHAAMELYAERGQRGPTLRAVGERADVSPGLVQHHYKTTQRLMAEVREWVSKQLASIAAEEAPEGGILEVHPSRFDDFLVANPVVAAYLRRGLLESSAPSDWFQRTVERRHEGLGDATAESPDPTVAAAMTALVGMAPMLLGPLLEHALECDAAELSTRWRSVENAVLGSAFAEND